MKAGHVALWKQGWPELNLNFWNLSGQVSGSHVYLSGSSSGLTWSLYSGIQAIQIGFR